MPNFYQDFSRPLQGKLLLDILELKDIRALDYLIVKRITNRLCEPYVRLLISKLPTLEEQIEFFEEILDEFMNEYDKPSLFDSEYAYLLDLKLQLVGKRQKLEPDPVILGIVHACNERRTHIAGVCGDWVLVAGDHYSYVYNWVESYEYCPVPWEWEDELQKVYEQEWCDTTSFDDLIKMILINVADMCIDEWGFKDLLAKKGGNVMFTTLKAETEPHARKRNRILDSYRRYFNAPTLPPTEDAPAKTEPRLEALIAENAELRQRCEALEAAQPQPVNTHATPQTTAADDETEVLKTITPMFRNNEDAAKRFLQAIKDQTKPSAIVKIFGEFIEDYDFDTTYIGAGEKRLGLGGVLVKSKLFPGTSRTWNRLINENNLK